MPTLNKKKWHHQNDYSKPLTNYHSPYSQSGLVSSAVATPAPPTRLASSDASPTSPSNHK